MSGVETRTVSRNSLFLLAAIRVEQGSTVHKVRVRNLSDGGMMGEGDIRVKRGNRLEIELRHIDPIQGSVAWVQDNRFGIAFDEEIDAERVRKPLDPPPHIRNEVTKGSSWRHRAPEPPNTSSLRKI
jgi:hypothetical protein